MAHPRLTDLDLAYARFNAARTLGDARPSAFRVEHVGDLVVTIDPARKATYSNRVLGLGAETLDDLDTVLARYEAAGTTPRLDVAAENMNRALNDALTARGFHRASALAYLAAEPGALDLRAVPGAPIVRWAHDRVDAFLDLLALDRPISAEIRDLRRAYYCTDGFRTYVAEPDGEPAAWATLFVHADMGLLGNAMTRKPFRGRGLHRALLQARLRDAARLGLTWVVSDVEPDTTSMRNCERAGLELLTTHTIWERVEDEAP